MRSFISSSYQLHTAFSTASHLFWENMESHWSNQKLLTAVVETPMWKLLLSFTEQNWGCSRQPGTPRWAENNMHSFVLKWLPFSLELKAAVASTSSARSTGKCSVRLFLWFSKIPFWEVSPMRSCCLIQAYCSYSLGIWASFWRMACFWYELQLKGLFDRICWETFKMFPGKERWSSIYHYLKWSITHFSWWIHSAFWEQIYVQIFLAVIHLN